MKVKIGNFCTYWGVYQISDLLQHIGVSEDTCDKIGKYLSKTKLNNLCEYIYEKRKRKVKIKIHDYDTWNLDETLALIILPCLKQLKETKHGAPFVDDSDVPDEFKSTSATPKENEWDTDEFWFARFDYILDEMIWGFERLCDPDDDDKFHTGNIDIYWKKLENGNSEMLDGPNNTHVFHKEEYLKHQAKIQNGLRLFGRYFRALWD